MNDPVIIGDAKLYLGDCREVLRLLPDASVDSIVTDPPYHLTTGKKGGSGPASVNLDSPYGRSKIGTGFMGMTWDGGDIAHNVEMWAECLRVLKPGGHLLAFSGTRTQHRMVCAIEDAGFEVRDQIGWLYGSGFPKSRNLDGDWQGWGTALKPAWEPICVARKPLVDTVAANVAAYGTGALNIDACRVHADDAQGGEYTVKRFAPGASVVKDGNWKQDVEFRGEMKVGRWPANVIHDGSPEVLESFPIVASGAVSAGTVDSGKQVGALGAFGGRVMPAIPSSTGSAARFFYCAKTSRADRNEGLPSGDEPAVETEATMRDRETADWPARNGNHHPTVKPTDLMAYLCRLVTPPGGVVLDPFMGSGSTGKAAMREGFRFIGIDMTPEYVEIAKQRIQHEIDTADAARVEAQRQPDMFSEVA